MKDLEVGDKMVTYSNHTQHSDEVIKVNAKRAYTRNLNIFKRQNKGSFCKSIDQNRITKMWWLNDLPDFLKNLS